MKSLLLEKTGWTFLGFHALVSLFGLAGIGIMLPNPDLWSGIDMLARAFPLALAQGGNVQIWSGAAAVLLFGAVIAGWRAALIFFGVSVLLSVMLELLGTAYGWPFGSYEYTDLFGYKIFGRVPPAIPLSWFSMAFSSFALAAGIIRKWCGAAGLWSSIALGSVMLTTWDLVLDPAMSNEALALQYWVWKDVGPYMGIPLINFLGWVAAGSAMMFAASYFDNRLRPIDAGTSPFFLAMYLCNLVFAIGICASSQLWLPAMVGSGLAAAVLIGWFLPRDPFPLRLLAGRKEA